MTKENHVTQNSKKILTLKARYEEPDLLEYLLLYQLNNQVDLAVEHSSMDIPIYIPSFNNFTYLKKMIEQLQSLGCRNIVVLDNCSRFPPMLEYLKELSEQAVIVIYLKRNRGPRYIFQNKFVYSLLPKYFCVTDPDLEFNSELDSELANDFMLELLRLTEEYKIGKVGFSLDISDPSCMVQDKFVINGKKYQIWEWEEQFWQNPLPLQNQENPVYKAVVDTTFALYNKDFFDPRHFFDALRVGGNFNARHLPWYKNNQLPTDEEAIYRSTSRFPYYLCQSTIRKQFFNLVLSLFNT